MTNLCSSHHRSDTQFHRGVPQLTVNSAHIVPFPRVLNDLASPTEVSPTARVALSLPVASVTWTWPRPRQIHE